MTTLIVLTRLEICHLDNTVPLDLVTEGMLKLENLIQMHFGNTC